MPKNRKPKRRRKLTRPSSGVGNTPASPGSKQPTSLTIESPEQESWHSLAWRASRSGARASRGFHFQEVVGAWLAARIAAGTLVADRLTPEGFDDLQLEGDEPVQFEVKSRQERRGSFLIREAARHIATAYSKHVERFGTSRRLVIVLERGIAGWDKPAKDPVTEMPLPQLMEEFGDFGSVITEEANSLGLSSTDIEVLLPNATLLICSWESLIEETERQLGFVVDLPTTALAVVRRDLWSMVAEAVDTNAEVEIKERASLTRTELLRRINHVAELVDLQAIEHALTEGICSLIDTQPVAIGDSYYEGVSTQPGHVSADLVVSRPELIEQVIHGLEAGRTVLLTGPSGVGKSAVLWTLPFAFPGVLWFRVNRVSDDDVPHVVRLMNAHAASPESPIGLLVDAVGGSEMEGWARLRKEVDMLPCAHLVGSARNEDLFSLGNLADCATVRVSLDEKAAKTIHAGLVRRGMTTAPHWREAFEQTEGLTLEFTHLLTSGRRLDDLVSDQIASRIREGLELRILASVATADRWSVSIPYRELESNIGAEPIQLRGALNRLVDEHLLTERDGMLIGIHPVRSRAIVEAIHRVPPPELQTTVSTVLNMLRASALSRFIYEALREVPDLEVLVLEALDQLAHDDQERLIACLQGLELVDFYRQAAAWLEVAERNDVPPAHQPFTLWCAIAGTELPALFPEQVRNAIVDMASLQRQSALKDALLERVGLNKVALELSTVTDAAACSRLLRAVRGISLDWTPLLTATEPGSRLFDALGRWSVTDLSDCISAARDISPGLAKAFVDAVGGIEGIFRRLRDDDPWIQKLRIDEVDGKQVGVARLLYISEAKQGDARERAVQIGRLLLRSLHGISEVDVRAFTPDGTECGVSKLSRQYDHHPDAVGWNQDRIRLAQTLFGASETDRLAETAEMLEEAAQLVRGVGNVFVRSPGRAVDPTNLFERCRALDSRARRLPPRLGTGPFSDDGLGKLDDPLSALITQVCGNVLPRLANPDQWQALSPYISNTVMGRYVPEVRAQSWRFLGLDGPPPALDDLATSLSDMSAVLTELCADEKSSQQIINAARSGSNRGALARAAERCRRLSRRRLREW